MSHPKVILFTCNWNAYGGMETAGRDHLSLPPGIHPLRVSCLGEVSPGRIIKCFEKGADGVVLLGCPPDQCHHDFGMRQAEKVFAETQIMLHLLGHQEDQLKLDWVTVGDGIGFAEKVQDFVTGFKNPQRRPKRA